MANAEKTIRVYQELARGYDTQGQDQVRDRFLVLAADAALAAGRADQAEEIRARLLELNPHHLLKPFASFAQALQSIDVKNYVEGLRRTYSVDHAEQMLQQMHVEGEPPITLAPLLDPRTTNKPASTPRPPLPERPAVAAKPPPAPEAPIPFAPEPPTPPAPPTPKERRPARTSEGEPGGNWVATVLFMLVLTAALTLAVYTLVHPFLSSP